MANIQRIPAPGRLVAATAISAAFLAAVYACSQSSPTPTFFSFGGDADAQEALRPDAGTLATTLPTNLANTPACAAAADGGTSSGCEYFVVFPNGADADFGVCAALFVVNFSGAPVGLEVDRGGAAFDLSESAVIPSGSGPSLTYSPLQNSTIPPASVAIVILGKATQPVPTPGVDQSVAVASCPAKPLTMFSGESIYNNPSSIGHAFHVTTSAPTTAYDMFPYGGGGSAVTSATLLLPTTVWGTNYVAVMPPALTVGSNLDSYGHALQVVALNNDTHVTILPTQEILAGVGIAGGPAMQTEQVVLQAGQLLLLAPNIAAPDLSGSVLQSDKPIGVWGSAACFSLPSDAEACDSAHQQIPPISALGSTYAAVRYRSRIDGTNEPRFRSRRGDVRDGVRRARFA